MNEAGAARAVDIAGEAGQNKNTRYPRIRDSGLWKVC